MLDKKPIKTSIIHLMRSVYAHAGDLETGEGPFCSVALREVISLIDIDLDLQFR